MAVPRRGEVRGRAKSITYGLTTSSDPVSGSKAGDAYAATAKVRSSTRPRQSVCLVIKERTRRGALVQAAAIRHGDCDLDVAADDPADGAIRR